MSAKLVELASHRVNGSADEALERSLGEFSDVLVIGYAADNGDLLIKSSAAIDQKTAVFLVETFKAGLFNGEFNPD